MLKEVEIAGESNRVITIVKSRGMSHSNQIREFLITEKGIELLEVYTGPAGVLTGSARASQEAREKAEAIRLEQEIENKQREFENKRMMTEARIAKLRAQLAGEQLKIERIIEDHELRKKTAFNKRAEMARLRMADKKV